MKPGYYLFFLIFLLCMAILYIWPLGTIPVHTMEDECRRALVPLEMMISGDWLRPTINGELYLNKPPLYNWIVAASYSICDSFTPFTFRLPVIISILAHGAVIFYFVRRYTNDAVAALTAIAFMTNWRTLTLDSLLGLLEHTLALVIYAGFMCIFYFGERKKYTWLFLTSYGLAAIGFLIKGLPPLAHHLIAILVYVALTRNRKLLFSKFHLAGVLLFTGICGAFYIPFVLHNHIPFREVVQILFEESAKRYGFKDVMDFVHVLFDFPLDFIKHFLPWTLLVVLLFRKGSIQFIKENKFVLFNAFLFVSNILVYWFASLKNPHYLYFLLPLLFTILFHQWDDIFRASRIKRSMEILFAIALMAMSLAAVYLPFSDVVSSIPAYPFKAGILVIMMIGVLYGFYRLTLHRMEMFMIGILVLRLGFNWFAVPQRVEDQMGHYRLAEQVMQFAGDSPLYIYASYPAGYYDAITFPLELKRQAMIPVVDAAIIPGFYLVDDVKMKHLNIIPLMSFPFTYADRHEWIEGRMHLIKWE